MKRTIEEVKTAIAAALEDNGIEAKITVTRKIKANRDVEDAIAVQPKGMSAAPTLEMSAFQVSDSQFEAIIDNLIMSLRNIPKFNIEILDQYETAAPNIRLAVVNLAKNEEYLSDKVWKKYLNLAIIAKVIVGSTAGDGMVTVTQQMLDKWDISEEQLFEDAWKTTEDDVTVKDIRGAILEICPNADLPDELTEDAPMLVVSNSTGTNGAIAIANKPLLARLSEKYGNFYLLPSSLHEVLLIPESANADAKALLAMVQDVNTNVLEGPEYLADAVYKYHKDDKILSIDAIAA